MNGVDIRPTLGEYLRQERERRNITVEQVASATKISIRLLHALEADDYTDLPAKPFIRGFVTSYAKFIDLDPQEILTRYSDFIHVKSEERPHRESGHSGYIFEKREGEQNRITLWVVLLVFIILGGTVMAIIKPKLKHHKHTRSSGPTRKIITPPSPIPSPSLLVSAPPSPMASITPSPSPTPIERPDPLNSGINLKPSEIRHKIIFRALEDLWVRYQVDERPITRIILRKGRILVLRTKKRAIVQVSNPDSITLDYNNRGQKLFADEEFHVGKQGNASLAFPAQDDDTIEETFSGSPPLPLAVPMSQRSASPTPIPSN